MKDEEKSNVNFTETFYSNNESTQEIGKKVKRGKNFNQSKKSKTPKL